MFLQAPSFPPSWLTCVLLILLLYLLLGSIVLLATSLICADSNYYATDRPLWFIFFNADGSSAALLFCICTKDAVGDGIA